MAASPLKAVKYIYMFSPMQNQIRCTTEFFITVRTLDRFASMECQVGFIRRVLRERFATKFTNKWTLARLIEM